MNTILYLYREIMPYNIPVLKELVKSGFEVAVVHRVKRKRTTYDHPELNGVNFYAEENFNKAELKDFAKELNPKLVFVSDWSDSKYNYCASFMKNKMNIPVVVGCDTQWKGGRQWFNVFTSSFRQKKYFTHVLTAGVRQFEYAKKIGFRNDEILLNLLSADTEKFNNTQSIPDKFEKNRKFLFVGRFAEVKGLHVLLEAWKKVKNKNGATLTLVGSGPLKEKFDKTGDVVVLPFMNQDKLITLSEESSCFILPSVYEPWALVIHEFAAAGLPLIVTNECGASPHFVINNYNGYVIKSDSVKDLQLAIEKIINADSEKLEKFSIRSRTLSKKINPEIVAQSFLSVLN